MKPELRRVGSMQSPVVVIDEFSGAAEEVASIADSLAPFPPVGNANYYPGPGSPAHCLADAGG